MKKNRLCDELKKTTNSTVYKRIKRGYDTSCTFCPIHDSENVGNISRYGKKRGGKSRFKDRVKIKPYFKMSGSNFDLKNKAAYDESNKYYACHNCKFLTDEKTLLSKYKTYWHCPKCKTKLLEAKYRK